MSRLHPSWTVVVLLVTLGAVPVAAQPVVIAPRTTGAQAATENLTPIGPVLGVTATPATSGGNLADATYTIQIVGEDGAGRVTAPSTAVTCVVSGGGGAGSCGLAWTHLAALEYYRVYVGSAGTPDRYVRIGAGWSLASVTLTNMTVGSLGGTGVRTWDFEADTPTWTADSYPAGGGVVGRSTSESHAGLASSAITTSDTPAPGGTGTRPYLRLPVAGRNLTISRWMLLANDTGAAYFDNFFDWWRESARTRIVLLSGTWSDDDGALDPQPASNVWEHYTWQYVDQGDQTVDVTIWRGATELGTAEGASVPAGFDAFYLTAQAQGGQVSYHDDLTITEDATVVSGAVPGVAESVQGTIAIGTLALYVNATGIYNAAVGYAALMANTTGSFNTAVSVGALTANTTGLYNTAVGPWTLVANTTGRDNTALGPAALFAATTGYGNTAVGPGALFSATTGIQNTAIGPLALYHLTTGASNVAIGPAALNEATTGTHNTAIGTGALQRTTTGLYNTAIGWYSGVGTTGAYANFTGSSNTWIGFEAGPGTATQLNNTVAIGKGAQVTADNQVVIGTTSSTDFYPGYILNPATVHGRQLNAGVVGSHDRLLTVPAAKGATQADGTVTSADLTAARTWTYPDLTGTIALGRRVVTDVTTTAAPAAADAGGIYRSGDADGSTVTLPNDPTVTGLLYRVVVDTTQSSNTVTVAPSSGESLYYAGATYTTSCTSTQIGASLTIVNTTTGSGAKWIILNLTGSWSCS